MVKNSTKNSFKALSKRVRLLLNHEEGYDVEFKQSLSGLDNTDLVAFANSEAGGSLLIGVTETQTGKYRQKGGIIGCPVGDKEKISIINKAEDCVPPLKIEIFVENSNRIPFYRIEIPSGNKKPYCTARGTYKIRGDGRTKALLPGRLLSMFAETESQQFIERFRKATKRLENSLADTKSKIIKEINELLSDIQGVEHKMEEIDASLEQIFSSAESAESLSDEAMGFSDETLGMVHEVDRKVENIEESAFHTEYKIGALLNHFGIEDPHVGRLRSLVKKMIEEMLKIKKGIKKEELLKTLQDYFPDATKEQLELWYTEKVDELKSKGSIP